MPLQFQNVSIPFKEGVDTKTDNKLVMPGKLIDLQNGRFQKNGRIRKRFGWSTLGKKDISTDLDISDGRGIGSLDEELNLFAGQTLYSYVENQDNWSGRGSLVSLKLTSETIVDNTANQSQQDFAYANGLSVYAWVDSRGGIRATVTDESTGSNIQTDVEISSTGDRPRVVAISNFFFIFYRESSTLKCRRLKSAIPTTFETAVSIQSDLNSTNPNFDFILVGTAIVGAYNDSSNEVNLFYFRPIQQTVGTLATGYAAQIAVTGEEASNCLNLYLLDTMTIVVAYHADDTGVRAFGRDLAFVEVFAPVTLDNSNPVNVDTFVDGDVNTGTDEITLTAHAFSDNDRVMLTTTGTLPTGLSTGTNYYVIYVDANTIQLSLTEGPGSAVDITAAAGGGTHTITYQDFDVATNITGAKSDTDTVKWYWEIKDPLDNLKNYKVKYNTVTTSGTVGTATILLRSVGLGLQAFIDNTDEIYLGVVHESTQQTTLFIIDESGNIHARVHALVHGGLTSVPRLPKVSTISDREYAFASSKKVKFQIEDAEFFTREGVTKVNLNFDSDSNYLNAPLADSLYVAGGMVSQYDTAGVVEAGFHVYPEDLTATASASGGSMSDGTYSTVAVYEWVDSKGKTHKSAPSTPIGTTLSGGGSSQSIAYEIPTLRLTSKTLVAIHLYSTEDAGVIYYRTTSVLSPTLNDKTVDSVTITRTEDDSTLIGNEILYTTGGVVENIAPPSANLIVTHQNRVMISGLEDPYEFQYSKEYVKGEGVAFSDLFIGRVEQVGGAIFQIASMDDKFVIFKKNRIYVQTGRGPNPAGGNNDYSIPTLVSTDSGCTESKSVVLTPSGLMYKGDKGIYLLSRQADVSYIGADVEAYNSEMITSAVLIEGDNEVRFTTESGRALVYNYYFNQWSTFTRYEAVGAVNWKGNYVHLKSTARVRKEVKDQFLDDGQFYKLSIETAWLKMAGLQGFQRVRRMILLGEYFTPHTLTTSLYYDYEDFFRYLIIFNATDVIADETYGSDATYGDSEVYGGEGGDGVYQFRAHMPRQKCQSIKFKFEDEQDGEGIGESFAISDLTLEVGLKKGVNKLIASKTL